GETRSLLAGAAHLLLDVVEDLFRGERADLRRVVLRVADLESAHGLDEPLLELGRDLLVDNEPLGRDAALTGVLHARRHGDLHCLVQIRTGQNDEWIAAAQLEDRLLQLRARSRRNAAARSVAAGQRGRGDGGILEDLFHFLAPDQQRLEAAFREAGLAEDLLDRQGALGDVARVLQQADVARHQGGCGESEDLPEREVPGHHRQHRTERLEALLGAARVGLDGFRSEVALGGLGVVAAAARAVLDLGESRPAELDYLKRTEAHTCILALYWV